MKLMRLPKIITAAGLATLALAAPASADSISFLRGGDIWVASTDGSKQVQITHSGGYSYQSQADDGTFIALAGRRLHRLDRKGNVLADFSTPVSGDIAAPNDSEFRGPFKPEISPDGTKVVYEYFWDYEYHKPGCEPAGTWYCTERHTYQGVAYSYADRMTGWDELGRGNRSGWVYPSWIDNDTITASHPSEPLNVEVKYNDLDADPPEFQDWFTDESVWNIKDGEVARQGDKAVFITTKPYGYEGGHDDGQVTIYTMNGPAPAAPQQCMSYTSGHLNGSPTFSPAGDGLAWEVMASSGNGYVYDIMAADPNAACNPDAEPVPGTVIIADGRQPDWGPADVPQADRPTKPVEPADDGHTVTPEPQQPQRPTQPVEPTRPAIRKVTLNRRALARAVKRGLVVKFKVPGAGTVSAEASQGARLVAKGSRRAARAGTVAVRLRFGAAARRALRGRRSARLTVRMTFRAG